MESMYKVCFCVYYAVHAKCDSRPAHSPLRKPYYLGQAKLLDFFVGFLQDIAKDLSSIKISVNHRARTVARNYLKSFK